MPDNLRITAPIPNSEGIGKTNSPKEPPNIDAVDPARVTQPGTQEHNVDSQSLDLLLNLESVYGKFIQQLRRTPTLSKSLGEALADAAAAPDRLLARLPADSPLRRLVENLPMTKEEVCDNLRFQQENSSRFNGTFFQILSLLSEQSTDGTFDLQLAGFLKAYDAFRNAGDTTKSVLRDLKNIERQIPGGDSSKLKELAAKLSAENPAEAAPDNLRLLKKEILPLLGRYVSRTNDYGRSRESISLLVHHTTMLEAGVKENVTDSFRKLTEYAKFSLNLPDGAENALQSLFAGELAKTGQTPQNRFLDALLSLLTQRNDGSPAEQASGKPSVYRDICRSLLLDSSVYMPYTHLFLPFTYDGRYLFAQIWVEKDSEDSEPARSASAEKPLRVYLSFEIQDLGHFEASVQLTGKSAELSIGYPPSMDDSRREIRTQLASIFEANGLTLAKTSLAPRTEPKLERELLKKIEERKHAVNVTV